jgi:hypothetical protein
MADVSDEELLRLARLAWPNEDPKRFEVWSCGTLISVGRYGTAIAIPNGGDRTREAMRAALRVLAGEGDHA